MRVPVVVLARGGSKGIPSKNLIDFCGKPLLVWTLEFALASSCVLDVWVSTDDADIAELAAAAGAHVITRPDELSTDTSSSEEGWVHALDELVGQGLGVETFAALQPTSPLRKPDDLDRAVAQFNAECLDSLFSGSQMDDVTLWEASMEHGLVAVNHDPSLRIPRQEVPVPIIENGSIYLMKSSLLRSTGTRFAGRVGYSPNMAWQAIEVDSVESLRVAEVLMRSFVIHAPTL